MKNAKAEAKQAKLTEANRVKLLSWSTVQLKGLYTRLLGKTFKANDKQHLAQRLAKELAKSGAKAGDPPDEIAAKAPELKIEGDKARELLKSVQTNWDEVDSLKAERREACAAIRGEVAQSREAIAKQLGKATEADNEGDGDAARKALRRIDAEWRKIGRREKDLASTRAEYTERINAANGRIRDVLANMRQTELDFGGYDVEAAKAKGKQKGNGKTPAKKRGAGAKTKTAPAAKPDDKATLPPAA